MPGAPPGFPAPMPGAPPGFPAPVLGAAPTPSPGFGALAPAGRFLGGVGICLGAGGAPGPVGPAGSEDRAVPVPRAGGTVLTRCDEAGRAAATSSSAAASWCGWGRDTSRARIAALTVTFMLGMLPPRPVSHATPLGPRPAAERGLPGDLPCRPQLTAQHAG